jgi:hypothetical protein
MDDRGRIPGGEGSLRALCDRDPSALAKSVGAQGTVRALRHRRHRVPAKDPEIDRALEGMSALELRLAVRIDAMRIAAEKRTEGILGNSRRQHYGHAALLVASCVAFAPKSRASEFLRWAADLRQQYWRRHAFREELARASESLGVLVPV